LLLTNPRQDVDRVATILFSYPEGSPNEPRGAMLSHHNLLSNFEALRQVFAEDVVYDMGEASFSGADAAIAALRGALQDAPRMRHVVSSVEIDEHGPDQATALSDWVMLANAGGGWAIARAGRYRDRLRRSGDRWVFTERAILTTEA
jgi:acyl-CoA synthetase (AMP-forming)/AMP-acid ligase II